MAPTNPRQSRGRSALTHTDAAEARWNPFVAPQSSADPGSRISALSRRADNFEVLSFAPDDFPQGTYWYPDGQGWRRSYTVPGPAGSPMGGITAVSRADTTMEAFWIGRLGFVRGAYWYDEPEGDKQWHEFHDPVAGLGRAHPLSGIASASRRDDHMEIWWVGLDGSIQASYWYERGPQWRPYQIDGTGLDTAARSSGVGAVSRMPDALSAFWIKPDGEVQGAYWRDQAPYKWRLYTNLVAGRDSAARSDTQSRHCIAVVSPSPDRIDVVWISPKGEVNGAYWAEGQGAAWHPYAVAGAGSASAVSGIALISPTATTMEAFWVRPHDLSVQGSSWKKDAGWRLHEDPISGRDSVSPGSGIAATLRNKADADDGETVVTWVGRDLSVRGATRGSSASGAESVVHGVVRKDGQPHPEKPRVRVFDADRIDAGDLGNAAADLDGTYRITYKRPRAGVRGDRVGGDFKLLVAAYAGDSVLAQSVPIPNPDPIEQVDLDVVSERWVVRGVVEDPVGQPLSGVTVVVADRDLGLGSATLPVDEMGRAVSGSDGTVGGFRIAYLPRATGEATRDGRWTPDLTFRVHTGGVAAPVDIYRFVDGVRPLNPLRGDDVTLGIQATPHEQVALRLAVPPPPAPGANEFDTLEAAIRPLLPAGSHAGMLNEELHRDISFTAREIGADIDLVKMFVDAHRLAHNGFRDVDTDILYGLARCDLHLVGVMSLVAATREQLMAGVEQAISDNRIRARDTAAIERAVANILQQGPDLVLDGIDGGPAYKAVLDIALGADAQARALQQAVVRAAAGNATNPKAMWDALRSNPNVRDKVSRIQLTLQLDALTSRNTTLMTRIANKEGVKTAKDLLAITAKQFESMIDLDDVPEDLPGDTNKEKATYWAAALSANLHQAFPTLSVARSVRNAPPLPDIGADDERAAERNAINGAVIRDALATVLERAADIVDTTTAPGNSADGAGVRAAAEPSMFDIGRTRLDPFITQNRATLFQGIPAEAHERVTAEFKRTQRLYRVSSSPAAMDWLLTQKFGSAFEIAMQPQQAFVAAAATPASGAAVAALAEAEAMVMHTRARAIANSVVATHLQLWDARYAAGIAALNPDLIKPVGPAADGDGAVYWAGPGQEIDDLTSKYLPSWVQQFGSANYCSCKDCHSIYSPAAYLVTLLDFLDAHPNAEGNKPLDVLLTRRPDLQDLLLTCENTNTQIPYVDLVNRVLESLVKSLDPQSIPAYDIAGATSAELAAAPQNTDWGAYVSEPQGAKRADRAAHPNRLPFDAALHAQRAYLAHLKVPRATLVRTFIAVSQPHALAAEVLGLAPATFELITGATLDDDPAAAVSVDERYGFDVEPPGPLEEGTATHPVRGRVVWALKLKLNAAGANLPPDANPAQATFDATVTTAVRTYQAGQGLSVNGKVNTATWRALTSGQPHLSTLLLPHVPTFLHRTALTYAELIDVLKMRVLNPQHAVFDIVLRLRLPAQPLIDWIDNQLQGPVPTELIEPLDSAKIPVAEFQAWAIRVIGAAGGMSLRRTIVVDNPNPAACDLETSLIRYWDAEQSDISDSDWTLTDRLIRLWRATGWTFDDLDLALVALAHDDNEPLSTSVVRGLARITEMMTTLDLTVAQVVLLFSDLDPTRQNSLYHKVFRNRASRHTDPAFDPDWTGEVLRDATIGKQLAALQGGLRIGDADMDALRAKLGLGDDDDELTLDDVSAMLRYVTLARALALNVRDLLTMLTITNTTLTTDPPTGVTWPLRDFVTEVQHHSLTDLNVAHLNNVVSPLVNLAPSDTRTRVLTDLAARLRVIDEDLKVAPIDVANPNAAAFEALARRVLVMLEQPNDLVEAAILILSGRDKTVVVLDEAIDPTPNISDTWRTRLSYQPHNPDDTQPGGAVVTCVGALTDDERAPVTAFSTDSRWATTVTKLHADPRVALTKLVDGVKKLGATVPAPSVLLSPALRDDGAHPEYRAADIATRLKKLVDACVPVVRDQARRATINQALLVVVPDATTLNLLLTGSRTNKAPVLPASIPAKAIVEDLTGLGSGVITQQAHQAYELLQRMQLVIDGLGVGGSDLEALVRNTIALRTNSAYLMRYADIQKVSAYTRCRDKSGGAADRLPELIAAPDETKARTILAEILAVPVSTITDTVVTLKVTSLRDPVTLETVMDAVRTVLALGVSVQTACSWVRKPLTPPSVEEVRAMVDQIRRAVQARYGETAWLEVAKALHDPQRDARRSALVDYLVARLDWLAIRNPDGLYQRLYVQVEMSSCMKTSPIRLAIDSVHTFIHRCELGLEKPVVNPGQIDERWRQILHNQQLWRADLEVLVNPENYMLPELRDDKSPTFVDLEAALLSEDLTDEAAERAITDYVLKADTVAKLDVVALHVQRDFELDEKLQAVAHVIARTANLPYKHYYRRFVVTAARTEGWTPWHEVPVDVRGDLITMVTFERRLYLFWAMVNTKTQEAPSQSGPLGPQPQKYQQEIQLCWSEYRNGEWGPKNVSGDSEVIADEYFLETGHDGGVTVQGTRRPKGLIERLETRIEGNVLRVLCIAARKLIKTTTINGKPASMTGPLAHGDIWIGGKWIKQSEKTNSGWTYSLGSFVLDDCHGRLRVARLSDYTPDGDWTTVSTGSALLLTDGRLAVKNFDTDPLPTRTVLNRIANCHLGEEDWIHLGPDYLAISDSERVYFATLRRQGPVISDILIRPDANVVIGDRDLRVKQLKFADRSPLLSEVKEKAEVDMRPWTAHTAGLALYAATRPARVMGAADAAMDATHTREVIKVDTTTINFARAAAFNVGLKSMFPQQSGAEIVFETFYDPFVCTYLKRLRQYGVPGLLTLQNQQLAVTSFQARYGPNTSIVKEPWPTHKVDFGFNTPGKYRASACAVTNRELFIELPMLLAKRLRENRRFEESVRYLKYVWDFTHPTGDNWRAEPLRLTPSESVEKWLTRLKDGDPDLISQIHEWQQHPFQPHFVARMRPAAYQRYVIMETLDTLLEWGDAEFRRDTRESITVAAQLYVLVADLLGKRPEEIATGTSKPKTFRQMRGQLIEGLAVVSAEFENVFPTMSSSTLTSSPDTVGLLGISKSLYFCVPPNQKLLAYWDTVADRLHKIRHCMNIEGVVRELPLFEPRIDPALLVRAAAQGLDFSTVIAEAGAPLPPYRFEVAIRRATEACGAVIRLGAQLLGALEREDAEKLAALNASHATAALKATMEIRKQQEEAAAAQIEALQTSRTVPAQRLTYYQFLMGAEPQIPQVGETVEMVSYAPKPQSAEGAWLIQDEINELDSLRSAHEWQRLATAANTLAGVLRAIPGGEIITAPFGTGKSTKEPWGGDWIGPIAEIAATGLNLLANEEQYVASRASRMSVHRRRGHELAVGANTAAREIMNIDKQITVAAINKEVARLEREQIELQIEQAEAIGVYLDGKFNTAKMYGLMQGKLQTVYSQYYKLAYDLAKQAERCYRYRYPDLGDGSIIQAGNWESGRKGLLAGEYLELQLRQLERAYADRDTREFELTKHISLRQHAPMALIALRETGKAEFDLSELLFDLDNPGHYRRRIKSVSLTIPAVVGPFSTVNATLTLLGNEIRTKPTLKNQKYERDLENPDDRFVDDFAAIQQIATSSGQNDHGLFELNFRDERFLPFEGAGTVSRWRIDIDPDCNPFEVPDVVMSMRFVAAAGGEQLRQKAKDRWIKVLKDREGLPLARIISLRHEFPTEWDRLRTVVEASGEHTVAIALTRDRFPALFRRSDLTIGALDVFGMPEADQDPTDLPDIRTPKQSAGESVDLTEGPPIGSLLHKVAALDDEVAVATEADKAKWWLTASEDSQKDSLAKLRDILLVVHYSAKSKSSS